MSTIKFLNWFSKKPPAIAPGRGGGNSSGVILINAPDGGEYTYEVHGAGGGQYDVPPFRVPDGINHVTIIAEGRGGGPVV